MLRSTSRRENFYFQVFMSTSTFFLSTERYYSRLTSRQFFHKRSRLFDSLNHENLHIFSYKTFATETWASFYSSLHTVVLITVVLNNIVLITVVLITVVLNTVVLNTVVLITVVRNTVVRKTVVLMVVLITGKS